jgi:putative DNA primase/helicase
VSKFDVKALKLAAPLAEVIALHGIELRQNGDELHGLCPFHTETTPSFTVEPEKGVSGLYHCFGCGEGGDQVAFLAKLLNLTARQAMERLAEIGRGEELRDVARIVPRGTTKEGQPAKSSPWQAAPTPPPRDQPPPKTARLRIEGDRYKNHPIVASWGYRDGAGDLHAYDCRVEYGRRTDPQSGKTSVKKVIVPHVWKVNLETGECAWRQGSLPRPRILYGAELLASNPGQQVLVVEGCKTADAARRLLAGLPVIVVSWMGGSKAVKFSDWSALAGRKVMIWPDCDSQRDEQSGQLLLYVEQPGMSAALAIAEQVEAHGCQSRIVEVPFPGGAWEDGYDLADAETEGRDQAWVSGYLRDHLRTVEEIRNARAPEPVRDVEGRGAPQDDREPPDHVDVPPSQARDEDPPPPPDDAVMAFQQGGQPFRILGWDRLTAYYLPDNSEQIIDLTASAHTKNNLIALAPLDYWSETFPSSKKNAADGVDWTLAINTLIQRSQSVGIYDPDLVRGRGAWWEDGKWAVHLGNRVIIDGKSYTLREAPTRYVYEKAATMRINFERPLDSAEAVKLMKICERLRWLRPISGKLLAGWIFLAPICGAIDWRPHIWITGGAGSGKSTVMRHLIGRCLRGVSLQVEGDTSEAGIRQSLVHDARPVVFDEFESERRKAVDRVEDVLAMVTRASSESDAQLIKGSGDGKAQGYRTRAMFAFSSIAVNLKQFAAASRVTVLDLYTEPESEASLARYNEMMAELYATLQPEYIQRLQARAVHMIPVIRKNATTFSEAASLALKSRRMGDQIGTLLAGVYALHSRNEISREDAVEWIHRQSWDDVAEVAEGKDESNCLAHVLSYQLRLEGREAAVQRSFGELVQLAAEVTNDYNLHASDAAATLRRHGIKVDGSQGKATVSFASNHRELKRILADTPWQTSYTRTLLRLDGAHKHGPAKYGAVSARGVTLPIASVLG